MQDKLTIDFGNEAMQAPEDAALLLRHVARNLDNGMTSGYLRDVNGNTVGHWEIGA